jgi:hypothetical protein
VGEEPELGNRRAGGPELVRYAAGVQLFHCSGVDGECLGEFRSPGAALEHRAVHPGPGEESSR